MHYYQNENLYTRISLTGNKHTLYAKVLHRFIEKRFGVSDNFPKTLEIGSDQGQHRSFVKHQYEEYVECDLHLPNTVSKDVRVKNIKGNINNLPFSNNEFDRVVLTCILHHIEDVGRALNEVKRVTKINGQITVLVPKEPSMIYFLVRNVLMLLKHKNIKRVLEFHKLHQQQHIGNYKLIINAIKSQKEFRIQGIDKLPPSPFTLLYCFVLKRQ